jgi:hypothetical protein
MCNILRCASCRRAEAGFSITDFRKKKIGSVIFWRREMLDKKGRCHYTKNKEKALPAKWSAPYRHLVKKD